jgi:hypothetical protein
MAKGSWLREDALDEILQTLHTAKLLLGRPSGKSWKAGRSLYKEVEF